VQGTACFIGTPKGRNHFYELIQTHCVKESDPDWEWFHFSSYENPYLQKSEIEVARKTMASGVFRQEFLASFETGGTDHFKDEWFKYEEEEPYTLNERGEKTVIPGDWYVTVDLAGRRLQRDVEPATATSPMRSPNCSRARRCARAWATARCRCARPSTSACTSSAASPPRTSAASCIAISSPRTSSSPKTAW
jgi:hypothetical protein